MKIGENNKSLEQKGPSIMTFIKGGAQSVQGRYYYKKIHHDKFILFGLEWVNVIDLSQKWASSREKVGKIFFFFKIFPIFSSILALLTNILTFFMELLETKLF